MTRNTSRKTRLFDDAAAAAARKQRVKLVVNYIQMSFYRCSSFMSLAVVVV